MVMKRWWIVFLRRTRCATIASIHAEGKAFSIDGVPPLFSISRSYDSGLTLIRRSRRSWPP